jgi:hypothetical protein
MCVIDRQIGGRSHGRAKVGVRTGRYGPLKQAQDAIAVLLARLGFLQLIHTHRQIRGMHRMIAQSEQAKMLDIWPDLSDENVRTSMGAGTAHELLARERTDPLQRVRGGGDSA